MTAAERPDSGLGDSRLEGSRLQDSAFEDDETLMVLLQAGNRAALVEIHRRYARLVLSIAIRILHNVDEAQEIAQEVFLYLHERASNFDRRKGEAKGWLVQVTYHRALNRLRSLRRREISFGTDDPAQNDTLVGTFDLERHVTSNENRALLREAFLSLTEKQRRTLEMFFFEDLDFDEIADRLQESLDNVRHYYYRGLQKLRKDAQVKKLKE